MKSRLNLLVGIVFMAAPGGVIVYGALTGRLAAMIAALIKPQDLGASGATGANGTPNSGTNADNGGDQNANLLTALVQQFNTLIRPGHPQAVQAFKTTVNPLIARAQQTRSEKDYAAAIAALRALITKYKPKAGGASSIVPGRGTVTKQGGSTDPTAGRPPILAPPVGAKS